MFASLLAIGPMSRGNRALAPAEATAPRLPSRAIEIDIAALPRPMLPSLPPEVRPLGEIRLSALRLPSTPPEVTPLGEIRFSALTFPKAPPDVPSMGELGLAALSLARTAPEIAPVVSPREIVARTHADPGLCTPAPGFTLAINRAELGSPGGAQPAFGDRLAAAAMEQVGSFVYYNARYTKIAYPMGDVSPFYGVCTDVIIRAYRRLGIDLQEAIVRARVGTGDTSIDHRRTEVMRKFLAHAGASLAVTEFAEDYLPGDIVTYYRPQNKSSTAHIAIVSSVMAPSGRPMIIHNRGWGIQLEDALFVDKITGHYRYAGPPADAPSALARASAGRLASARRVAPSGNSVLAGADSGRARLPAVAQRAAATVVGP
jgi:hypothetical protein